MTDTTEIFQTLRVVLRAWESSTGCSDVCQGEDGEEVIRLSIRDKACQKDFLHSADQEKIPMRLEREVLEALCPYTEGDGLREWLCRQRPSLGQRRDMCLSLLAHCAALSVAPSVLALSARTENLRFSQQDAWLLYLPDWSGWREGLETRDGVAAAARLCVEILTEGTSRLDKRRQPDELRVVCLRTEDGSYRDWGELSRDLTELPDELKSWKQLVTRLRDWLERRTRRVRKPAVCVVVCLLLAAAALSLAAAFRVWQNDRRNSWPGMTPIGNQQLKEESSR